MNSFGQTRFAGSQVNDLSVLFFTEKNIQIISQAVTDLTRNVDLYKRPIVVPRERIKDVMDNVYLNYRPQVHDIYTKYHMDPNNDNDVDRMLRQVIDIIVSTVRNTLTIENNNARLTKWATLRGDFNQWGLRSHAPIKLKKRRPTTFQFNMNY